MGNYSQKNLEFLTDIIRFQIPLSNSIYRAETKTENDITNQLLVCKVCKVSRSQHLSTGETNNTL